MSSVPDKQPDPATVLALLAEREALRSELAPKRAELEALRSELAASRAGLETDRSELAARRAELRKATAASVPLAEVMAGNLKALRERKQLRQADLAGEMTRLGFAWLRETVGQIETGRRRVALEEALALSVVLSDESGELYDCDGPIALSPSWDVFGLTISLTAEEPSQLAEARRHRDRLRRRHNDQTSMVFLAAEVADTTKRELEEAERQVAELEARSKP
jgi:transcriptional regulator with XRE-family HTH domain